MRRPTRSTLLYIAWHVLAILILLCLPVLKMRDPWWLIPPGSLIPLSILLAAYAISAAAVGIFVRQRGTAAAIPALAITLSVFAMCFAGLLFARFETPRYLLLPILTAALILIPLSVSPPGTRSTGVAGLGAVVLATGAFTAYSMNPAKHGATTVSESIVTSAFYNLRMVVHEDVVTLPETRGGGIDSLGGEVLLVDGAGMLYALRFDADGALRARLLPTHAPLNREEFAHAFDGSAQAPRLTYWYTEAGAPRVQTWRFRVADVLTQSDGDSVRIFISHHYWKDDLGCFVVRVSTIDASLSALDDSLRENRWRTLYESSPCVPLTGPQRRLGKNPFKGEEIGGRMALLDQDTLLLTLGDHGFSGIESSQAFAQDPQVSYGKTIRIDLNTQTNEIYTLGHRNPQGLYAAPDGRVWQTEHGSQGGDEVNLLTPHTNYGWPLVTYGTNYGVFVWPLNQRQGRHEGFAPPAFAWVPSIGVSSVTGIERDLFPIWRGDLIVGSLATKGLYRLVIEGDHIVLAEKIDFGRRVRDLLEIADGRLLVWTDDAALVTIEPASGMSGAITFGTQCSGCHLSVDGLTHRIGPDLHGIVGQGVASARAFDDYSAALRNMGGVWTRERLDQFLRDPQAVAPGTSMAFAGVKDDAERAALIDHLAAPVDTPSRW